MTHLSLSDALSTASAIVEALGNADRSECYCTRNDEEILHSMIRAAAARTPDGTVYSPDLDDLVTDWLRAWNSDAGWTVGGRRMDGDIRRWGDAGRAAEEAEFRCWRKAQAECEAYAAACDEEPTPPTPVTAGGRYFAVCSAPSEQTYWNIQSVSRTHERARSYTTAVHYLDRADYTHDRYVAWTMPLGQYIAMCRKDGVRLVDAECNDIRTVADYIRVQATDGVRAIRR